VVGFRARDPTQSCPDLDRVYGWCVEEVDFLDLSSVWTANTTPFSPEEQARLRTIGKSHAQSLEDLGVRWYRDDDVLSDTFLATGVTQLPSAARSWDASARHDRRLFSLPDRALWLEREEWLGTPTEEGAPFFRPLRFHGPTGVYAPPDTLILRGRFATRLAYDGRRHSYDIMDGDKDSSGPFFEQMYPYQRGMEGDNKPLGTFIVNNPLKAAEIVPDDESIIALRRRAYATVTFSLDEGFSAGKTLASREFERFYSHVGTEIVQFARAEYTPTHLRVLTALVAMHSPPEVLAQSVTARDVVAASEGQTDDVALIESLVPPGALVREDLSLDITSLPLHVMAYYVARFPQWNNPDRELMRNFNRSLRDRVRHYLRDDAREITSTDPKALKEWVTRWALPGREPDIEKHILPTALEVLLDSIPDALRDKIETRILLDHIDHEISTRFDPTSLATPETLEELAAGQWRSSLGAHGFFPRPLPDGPGAVDPLAICTTRDRREALSEPAFGVIDVDLLAVASDCLESPEEVLWEARGALPFVMIDDPKATTPTVERIVGLPGGRAVYRIRWSVWNGWHFLWGFEPLDRNESGDDAELRLALRTGAICEDTVLTSPDLLPTLARAALLEGEFRPAAPMKKGKRSEWVKISEMALSGELLARRCSDEPLPPELDSREGVPQDNSQGGDPAIIEPALDDIISEGERGAGQVQADPTNIAEQLQVRSVRSVDLLPEPGDPLDGHVIQTLPQRISYLQELMRAPLLSVAAQERLLLLVVMDTREVERSGLPWRMRPQSPYALSRARMDSDRAIHTSSWVTSIYGSPEEPTYTLISPAYQPTLSAAPAVASPVPRWKRNRSSDFTLASGIGPYARGISLRCREDHPPDEASAIYATVQSCEGDQPAEESTQPSGLLGLSLDLSSLYSLWVIDQPRIGVELGPALQLDVLWAGGSPFVEDDEPTPQYVWTFRPVFGALGGIRLALDPAPLSRKARYAIPWGAEGPNGMSKLGRTQIGLRTGALFGPGFNGLEADVVGELWIGRSIRWEEARNATLTPYHPKILVGPYVRGLYGFTLSSDAEDLQYKELANRRELIVGLRGQIRVNPGQSSIPKIE